MRYWPVILCIFYDNLDKIMVTKVNKVCIQFEAYRLPLIPKWRILKENKVPALKDVLHCNELALQLRFWDYVNSNTVKLLFGDEVFWNLILKSIIILINFKTTKFSCQCHIQGKWAAMEYCTCSCRGLLVRVKYIGVRQQYC